jgi:hypothetical protein
MSTPSEPKRVVRVLRRALFCDESGISGDHDFYGFGVLIMGYQRRGKLSADVDQLRRANGGAADEIKWSKTNRLNFAFYSALVDYFFSQPFLFFHCMVVERAWVNTKLYHKGSFDLARRKHFTQLLSNKIARVKAVHQGRKIEVRVYVDKLPSPYSKASEVMQIIGSRMVDKLTPLGDFAEGVDSINSLTECDSHDYLGIQLADLLLGAVVDSWNQRSTNPYKGKLKSRIASHLGWRDLRSDTIPAERKFNVWRLTDQIRKGQKRPTKTRTVVLRKPLPIPRVGR